MRDGGGWKSCGLFARAGTQIPLKPVLLVKPSGQLVKEKVPSDAVI